MSTERATAGIATRVTVAYPPNMGESGPEFLGKESFRRYLTRAWNELEPGMEIEEMVNLGCCTDAMHVPFTVESVEGGTRMGSETDIEFVEDDEPVGLGCGW